MLQYKVIEIFTSEEARWQGKQLHTAVVQSVNDLKIAARCIVTRGESKDLMRMARSPPAESRSFRITCPCASQ